MVHHHLGRVGLWPLAVRRIEVREKVVESGPHRPDQILSEALTCHACGVFRTAEIVVQENEGDVVPVLLRDGCEPPPLLR